ncbi:conserved exported protein of unknown function [Candidatus Nitrosocosmicus franklandus]|uniref:Uncharacterized protein n=2 Tax=Candidatus Nitrosocosmicus franklandianus TaxID=1798806 RepID=A0A484I781_9ARCH|nr:conserved exported protein of unknown function [Candidatus Nitrosocosmicus franklandus]
MNLMNKIITGIISALLVAGIVGAYVPNASATLAGFGVCTGNSALGQQPSSSGEQETEQGQAGEAGAQSIAPEFNALTGNNFNFNDQQNGECSLPLTALEESPLASTAAIQNSTSQ